MTPEQKAELEALKGLPDEHIDTGNIAPLTDTFWRNAVRNPFYFDDSGIATPTVGEEKLGQIGVLPLRARFAALRAAHPLPAVTGEISDKAFFDDLSGES